MSNTPSRTYAFLSALLALSLSACCEDSTPNGNSCNRDENCDPGFVCVDSTCRAIDPEPDGGVSDDGGLLVDAFDGADSDRFDGGETGDPGDGQTGDQGDDGQGDQDVRPPEAEWVYGFGGIRWDECSSAGTFDDGSVAVSGWFTESAKFPKDDGTEEVVESAGWEDVFLARLEADGSLDWVRTAGGTSYDHARSLMVLPDDKLKLAGSFCGQAAFGAGQDNEEMLESCGMHDVFVANYDNDGSFEWAKSAGGSFGDEASSISPNSGGAFYLTGFFQEEATFGPGETNETTVNSAGGDEMFVARYDQSGSLEWVRRTWSESVVRGTALAFDANDDSVFVTGYMIHEVWFGPGEPNETNVLSSGLTDMFLLKYGREGVFDWVVYTNSWADKTFGHDMVALVDGSLVVVGKITGRSTFAYDLPEEVTLTTNGGSDAFLARYDQDGKLIWAKGEGGEGHENAKAVARIGDDAFVVVGYFDGVAVFGREEAARTDLVSRGGRDVFVCGYDLEGRLLWAVQAGGELDDVPHDVVTTPDGGIVVAGSFQSEAVFGTGHPDAPTLTSNGDLDAFVFKLRP